MPPQFLSVRFIVADHSQQVIITMLLTEDFGDLPSNSPVTFPEPEDVDDDYRISTSWDLIPSRSSAENGTALDVLHQQADVVMDLAFELLRAKSRIARNKKQIPDYEP